MHLLYVIDSVVPAGAESSLLALAPHYVGTGIELEVAYLHDRPGLQDQLSAVGARLVCLDGPGGRAGWLARLTHLVRDRRPDLVHTTLYESDVIGRVAARLGRTPVVSTLASEPYGESHVSDPALQQWKVRTAQVVDGATARLTRRLHSVAATVADTMARRLCYPRERIDVVPRGRDADALGRRTPARRAVVRAALGIEDTRPLLLAVARHEFEKGLDLLVDATSAIHAARPDARVLVAGRVGNQSEQLRTTIEDQGLGSVISLLGARSDVADLMAAADVFVMPSRREGSPGALLEAMALELPAVIAELPQAREVVGEDARFVAAGSPEALAVGVLDVLDDPVAARVRAERARQTFCDRFTIEAVAGQMLEFYDRALAPRTA